MGSQPAARSRGRIIGASGHLTQRPRREIGHPPGPLRCSNIARSAHIDLSGHSRSPGTSPPFVSSRARPLVLPDLTARLVERLGCLVTVLRMSRDVQTSRSQAVQTSSEPPGAVSCLDTDHGTDDSGSCEARDV